MKVSLVVDNNEMQNIYNFMKDIIRENTLDSDNDHTVNDWMNNMSGRYRTENMYCIVFDDHEVDLLKKISKQHNTYRHTEISGKISKFFDKMGDTFWDADKPPENDGTAVWVSSGTTWDTGSQDNNNEIPF